MNDERRTPRWLFDKLNRKFCFSVDAASTDENALCRYHWTKESDGLLQDWRGETVWCNPPYSRGQLLKWVTKASNEYGALTLMLLPGDCSTKAGQLALKSCNAVLFLDRRLSFDDEPAGAKFASWIVMFGANRGYELKGLELGVVYLHE